MNLHIAAHYLRFGYRLRRPHWNNRRLMLASGTASAKVSEQDDSSLAIQYLTDGGWKFDSSRIELRDMIADDWEIDHDYDPA